MENDNVVSIYKYGDLKVMLVTNQHTLDEVLDAVDNAIRGGGYFPAGTLQYVEED